MAPRRKHAGRSRDHQPQYSARPIMGKSKSRIKTPTRSSGKSSGKPSGKPTVGRAGHGQRYGIDYGGSFNEKTGQRNSGKPTVGHDGRGQASYGRDVDAIRSYHGVGKVNKRTVGTALKHGGKRMAKEGLAIAKEQVMPASVDTKKGTVTANQTLGGPGVRMGLAAARGMGLPAPHPPTVYGKLNYKNPLQSKVGFTAGGEDFGVSAGGMVKQNVDAVKKGAKAVKNIAHSISHHFHF